ncbi:MAG: DUF1566 domain-containing protein [Nitrosomonadales bacterium]|nr:MAG: DUF1566 domain-containing protein [Nitrosomonadales bacterium]
MNTSTLTLKTFIILVLLCAIPVFAVNPAMSAEIAKDGRFIAYDDGTVFDTKMSLMWAAKDNGTDITWEDALNYAKNFRAGGYSDWRLPTSDELIALYDEGKHRKAPCMRTGVHVATELIELTCIAMWTSESDESNPENAAVVAFHRTTSLFHGLKLKVMSKKAIAMGNRALVVRENKTETVPPGDGAPTQQNSGGADSATTVLKQSERMSAAVQPRQGPMTKPGASSSIDCGVAPRGSGKEWWQGYANWCTACGGAPNEDNQTCATGTNWGVDVNRRPSVNSADGIPSPTVLVGRWAIKLGCGGTSANYALNITGVNGGTLIMSSDIGTCGSGHVDGNRVAWSCSRMLIVKFNFEGTLVSASQMEGTFTRPFDVERCNWKAMKNEGAAATMGSSTLEAPPKQPIAGSAMQAKPAAEIPSGSAINQEARPFDDKIK